MINTGGGDGCNGGGGSGTGCGGVGVEEARAGRGGWTLGVWGEGWEWVVVTRTPVG